MMTDQRPKIAALVADAFQEEEYFFPKVALNEAGYEVEVVSSCKEPVEIYSYFARTGLLDVDRAIAEARPEDYVGVLTPGGAKSPASSTVPSRRSKPTIAQQRAPIRLHFASDAPDLATAQRSVTAD
jgi:hypothetical protein